MLEMPSRSTHLRSPGPLHLVSVRVRVRVRVGVRVGASARARAGVRVRGRGRAHLWQPAWQPVHTPAALA